MHEAEFMWTSPHLQDVLRLSHCQSTLPHRSLESLLASTGFHDVEVEDLSDRVKPLWRFFNCMGYIPYTALKLFGMEKHFVNLMAGVEAYRNWAQGRYISVKAVKPMVAREGECEEGEEE